MSYLTVNGVRYFYEEIGEGDETIVFAHGVLMSSRCFQAQVQALSTQYRCIVFDWRGHGETEAPSFGYDVDTSLLNDTIELLNQLTETPVHFVGVALGGFIGLLLALHHPDRLRSLTVIASAADPEPKAQVRQLTLLSRIARWTGIRPLAGLIMNGQFAKTFMKAPEFEQSRQHWRQYFASLPAKTTTQALIQEVRHAGLTWEQVSQLTLPTLVIHGDKDTAIAPARAQKLADTLKGAQFELLENVAHSPTIEAPEKITTLLSNFIRQVG